MDPRKCMIVDLEKLGSPQMFLTERVTYIGEGKNGLWTVRFGASERIFNYNPVRLLYLTNPEWINLLGRGLYLGKRHISDVAELLRFTDGRHTYFRLTHANGSSENIDARKVYVTRTPITESGGSTLDYLRKLADETGLLTPDAENILARQYDMIDTGRDTVPLAQFLGDKTPLDIRPLPDHVLYPFGCNASQKTAVEAALTHQLSIIQGPPGTGKTQTILNIIANLVMSGQNVLVVSNNNSAIDNVVEKLHGEGLGFIVAKLGSSANKEEFIENQPQYPDMTTWRLGDPAATAELATQNLRAASSGFEAKERQARLNAELTAMLTESKHAGAFADAREDWLWAKPSEKIMRLAGRCRSVAERGKKFGLWARLTWALSLGISAFPLLGERPEKLITRLETAFYRARKREIESELATVAKTLANVDMEASVANLRSLSLKALKDRLSRTYGGVRETFKLWDVKQRTEEFLREYPVVLSTTYSAKNCINKDMVFDYLIMDEASQVDIVTGALSLSCANNVVIVGDDKQLPNVVSAEAANAIEAIRSTYGVSEEYDAATRSFLRSCTEVFRDVPITLLREHYRCHPKIIGFCNQMFYDNELIAMTADDGAPDTLQVIRTAKGNHARDHMNQREVDTIVKEVMPSIAEPYNVGIITPYRAQANAINANFCIDMASTVHKFQGRECDTIIMSLVDNSPSDFADNANLLNVAISRAKKRLCVVMTGNDIPPDSNIGQLVDYVAYNNFEVRSGSLRSVFDILYSHYTAERLAFESKHKAVSEYASENVVHETLRAAISDLGLRNTGIVCHYPLSKLVAHTSTLNDRERGFVESPMSHVDFLIYNTLTKLPICAIEVDGWQFHKRNEAQQERDGVKDSIMAKIGLRLTRLSTTDTVNIATMKRLINNDL